MIALAVRVLLSASLVGFSCSHLDGVDRAHRTALMPGRRKRHAIQ